MQQLLNHVRTRLVLRTFARAVAACFVGLALVGAVTALLGWLELPVAGWLTRPLALVAATVGALATSAVVAWRKAPSLASTARVVDRGARLAERLSTSLELGDRSDPLAAALRSDAEERCHAVRPSQVAPIALGSGLKRWLASSLAALVAAVAVGQVLPAPRVLGAEANSGPAAASSTLSTDNDFIQQLLETGAQAAAPVAATIRRNALPDSELQALASERRDGGAEQPTVSQQAPGAAVGASSPADQQPGVSPAQLADRSPDLGEALAAAQPQSSTAVASPPAGEAHPLNVRNDGTTNPGYDQPAARDQELREYARRRQTGSDPGGGGGDQVAMADAAVAGSATAGFDGEGAGEPLQAQADDGTDALDLPDITDSSGRRVTLERLPDMAFGVHEGWLPGFNEWAPGLEPTVTHDLLLQSDLDLLRRYNTPGASQAP